MKNDKRGDEALSRNSALVVLQQRLKSVILEYRLEEERLDALQRSFYSHKRESHE